MVTGAAGGMGAAVAAVLAERGHGLALLDGDEKGLAVAGDAIGGALKDARVVDVTDVDGVARAIDQIVGRSRPPSVVVTCAGVSQLGGIEELDEAAWDRIVDVNLKGTYAVCRAVLPRMVGGGAVVTVASVSGRTKSMYTSPAYVASKSGVIGLTMTLAAQWAAREIRVNCVAPGVTQTAMVNHYSAAQHEAMTTAIPMRRYARPREIATAIAFLASDDASYITGEVLNVNGGLFMI